MAPPTPRSFFAPRGAHPRIEGFFCFNLINVSPNLPQTARGRRLLSMTGRVKSDPLLLLPCCSILVFVFLINTSYWHARSTIELWTVLCNVLVHLMVLLSHIMWTTSRPFQQNIYQYFIVGSISHIIYEIQNPLSPYAYMELTNFR